MGYHYTYPTYKPAYNYQPFTLNPKPQIPNP